MASSPVALVQGANRGLGLAFVRILASRSSKVVATCRRPDQAEDLQKIPNVEILQVDVTNENHIIQAANHVKQKYGNLDLLINNAGLLHPSGKGETRLSDVKFEDLQALYAINAAGPLVMARHFVPLLQKGSGAFGAPNPGHKSMLVNITARAGSIEDNKLGGWYGYRMAKCALNMANRSLMHELGRGKNKVTCLLLNPGVVETDLSRPYHKSVPKDHLLSSEEAAEMLFNIMDRCTFKETGNFYDVDGSLLPN